MTILFNQDPSSLAKRMPKIRLDGARLADEIPHHQRFLCQGIWVVTGKVMVKVAPWPGALSTFKLPPKMVTKDLVK